MLHLLFQLKNYIHHYKIFALYIQKKLILLFLEIFGDNIFLKIYLEIVKEFWKYCIFLKKMS